MASIHELLNTNEQSLTGAGSYAHELDSHKSYLEKVIQIARDALPSSEEHFQIARRIADTRAPSGEESYTRGPLIRQFVEEVVERLDLGPEQQIITFYENLAGTGATGVYIGNRETHNPLIVYTHGDEITHDVGGAVHNEETGEVIGYKLTPLHTHRMTTEGAHIDAEVLRYAETDDGARRLDTVARGRVVHENKAPVLKIESEGQFVPTPSEAYRVVYQPLGHASETRLKLLDDGDTLEGQVDNCLGVSDAVASWGPVIKLAQEDSSIGVLYVVDGKEEGPFDPPQAFGKGGRALEEKLSRLDQFVGSTRLVVDGHDGKRGDPFPKAPVVADIVSNGKGPVMTLPRRKHIQDLNNLLGVLGGTAPIFDRQVGGGGVTTSRSGEQGASDAGVPEKNVIVMGYVENNPHFDFAGGKEDADKTGRPSRASLEQNRKVAEAIVIYAAADSKKILNVG